MNRLTCLMFIVVIFVSPFANGQVLVGAVELGAGISSKLLSSADDLKQLIDGNSSNQEVLAELSNIDNTLHKHSGATSEDK